MSRTALTFFRDHAFFAGVPLQVLASVVPRVEASRVERGIRLWSPGEPWRGVVFVRKGVLRIARPSEDREWVLGYAPRGAWFPDAIFEQVHDTTATVWEDADVLRLPVAAVDEILALHPELWGRLVELVANARTTIERRVAHLLFRSVHARVAFVLLDLANTFGVRDSRGVIVNLWLTHREIAGLIGATRETVSVAISDLRKERLMESEGKRIVLLDVHRLRRRAEA